MSYITVYIKGEKSDADKIKFSFHFIGFLGATFELDNSNDNQKNCSDFRGLFSPRELDKLELKEPLQLTCLLFVCWTIH